MRTNFSGLNADGSYQYMVDAMSGGGDGGPFSKYTHYTGYSARNIQNHMAGFPIPDLSYPSGYKKWNTATGQYEEFISSRAVPQQVGVPVATILGGYDPTGSAAIIYPVFHGNYGNVFNLEAPNLAAAGDQCWVSVSNDRHEEKLIKIAAARHHSSTINQLHFNLDANFRPTLAVLSCRRGGVITELTRTRFDGQIPDLPPVAIVGEEAGFNQLKSREFSDIEAWLQANTSLDNIPKDITDKIASYDRNELQRALTTESRTKLMPLLALQDAAVSTQVLLHHARHTKLDEQQTRQRLLRHLQTNGLLQGDMALQGSEISGDGYFFDARQGEDQQVLLTKQNTVAEAERSRWIQDQAGRLHLADKPWLCLTPNGNLLYAKTCQSESPQQRWTYHNNSQNPWVLRNQTSGPCLDFDRSNIRLITYSCTGSSNQRWQGITHNMDNWLSILPADALKDVARLLLASAE
jgi:hypothetical protein